MTFRTALFLEILSLAFSNYIKLAGSSNLIVFSCESVTARGFTCKEEVTTSSFERKKVLTIHDLSRPNNTK